MSQLEDGHSTFITFSEDADIKIWEKRVTPPGVDGGAPIDVTNMRNEVWRTRAFRKLKTLTDAGAVVQYDPAVYPEMVDMINVNQLITITFSDTSTLAFWGALVNFIASECEEGSNPEATCQVTPSNRDDSQLEIDPVYTAPA